MKPRGNRHVGKGKAKTQNRENEETLNHAGKTFRVETTGLVITKVHGEAMARFQGWGKRRSEQRNTITENVPNGREKYTRKKKLPATTSSWGGEKYTLSRQDKRKNCEP